MKVSYNWLQTYFDASLPEPKKLAELLTFHAFEIEEVVVKSGDTMIDVDVLANRGSDCLCHRGIAREVATITNTSLKYDPLSEPVALKEFSEVAVHIEAKDVVNRFSLAYVTGVKIGPSPAWLKEYLEVIGQKSINNVVDATNYVMFNLGQPLHAFDADKVSGGTKTIGVRLARKGEKITTLTNDEYELSDSNLLIVDGGNDTPLGIAGIKGGKVAEVDADTTNIILEAANFNYVSVRKTSQHLKLQTDASVRFQNQPSRELTVFALRDVVALLLDIAGGVYQGGAEWYPNPQETKQVSVALTSINTTLGTQLATTEVEAIVKRFGWQYELTDDTLKVTPPFERKDLTIEEDVIEEIGRIAGYTKLASKQLEQESFVPTINKSFFYANKIRRLLTGIGFSEVMTYALQDHGVVELENALASDKDHLRDTLLKGVQSTLGRNSYQAPLLGLSKIQLFEIGTVWKGLCEDGRAKEVMMLGIGVIFPKKIKGDTPDEIVQEAIRVLESELNVTIGTKVAEGMVEISLDKLIEKLPEPTEYEESFAVDTNVRYQPISPYPFVLRDIAVWVPETLSADDVLALIQTKGGELLVRSDLFDEFSKEGRSSYAFHLVFQSHEKTLSDTEVNEIMHIIEESLKEKGGEVR